MQHPALDVTFNVESDAGGHDPDQASPTLRRYHQLLWSKPLPDGTSFALDMVTPYAYLHHQSTRGEFFLTSDSIVHSYRDAYRSRVGAVMALVPREDVDQVHNEGCTIGGYLVFPGDMRDGKRTINGERGINARICDRFDLTLECIRRHYEGGDSPLATTMARYTDFFDLFGDFASYVDFFLLNDLVDGGTGEIRWYTPFDDFNRPPLPQSVDEYDAYRREVLRFVRSRNQRISVWAAAHLRPTR